MAAISSVIPTNGFAYQHSAPSVSTGSVTRVANRLYIAWVFNRRSGTPTIPTVSGFTQIDTNANGNFRVTALCYLSASPPGAGAITADFGGVNQTDCFIVIEEFTNASTQGTNGSGAILQILKILGTGATIAPDDPSAYTAFRTAFNSDSACAMGTIRNSASGDNMTSGVGFTELYDDNEAPPEAAVDWKPGAPTGNAPGGNILGTWISGTVKDYAVLLLEVKNQTTSITLGIPTETDSAASMAANSPHHRTIGLASEVGEVAFAMSIQKVVRLGLPTESIAAVGVNAIKIFHKTTLPLEANDVASLPIYPIE